MEEPSLVQQNARSVSSLEELLQALYDIDDRWSGRWPGTSKRWFFRGASKADYGCDPGLLREPLMGKDPQQIEFENWRDFLLRGRPHLPPGIDRSWQLMFLMQHHGLPTRLLDWTVSLCCAAYFAVRDRKCAEDGAVWILFTPYLCNLAIGQLAGHFSIWDEELDPYELIRARVDVEEFNKLPPLPLLPDHITPRVAAQNSRFTVHTLEPRALERLADADREEHGDSCFLHQIRIRGKAKAHVRKQVFIMGGVDEDSMFPDLDGLARGIRGQYEEG